MIDFILQNKEWLFSGVGVALIGGLIAFFWRKSRKEIEKPPQVVVHLSGTSQTLDIEQEHPLAPTPIQVTFADIQKAIDDAIPLQKGQIKENYVGIWVEWDAYLASASKEDDDTVELLLLTNKRGTSAEIEIVKCKVSLNEYRVLGILPEGARIRVRGEIERVDWGSINLKDVKLFFYDSSEEEGV